MVNISLLEKSIPVAPIKNCSLQTAAMNWHRRWILILFNSDRS